MTGNASRARAELGLALNTCLDIKVILIKVALSFREFNHDHNVKELSY